MTGHTGSSFAGLQAHSSNNSSHNGSFRESPFEASSAGSTNGASSQHLPADTPQPEAGPSASLTDGGAHNGVSNGIPARQRLEPARGVEPLDSVDAFDLWLDAADAIFPKQLAKSPMPPVTPVPGRRKHKPLLTTSHFLTAAPSCTLEIPSELEEGEVWERVRREASENARAEPMLSSFINAAVCSQRSFSAAVAFVLAHRLADVNEEDEMTTMYTMFLDALSGTRASTLADLLAVRTRDEACTSMAGALLYHGGFHSLQLQRVAHAAWQAGHKTSALRIQSLTSRALGADLHPAAQFGKGVFLAHPLGVVIGEEAVVGDHVTIMQHVTLGGTGSVRGDRHPKIGDYVQIGVKATILGNIQVGRRARVAAGSMVLKPVEEDMLVAGNPAKVIGRLVATPHSNSHPS
ncbi:g3040 [Coccomyxa elongata]